MEKRIYDIAADDFVQHDAGGTTGFIGWNRLARLLQGLEAKENEKLRQLIVDKDGIFLRFGSV